MGDASAARPEVARLLSEVLPGVVRELQPKRMTLIYIAKIFGREPTADHGVCACDAEPSSFVHCACSKPLGVLQLPCGPSSSPA